MSKRTPQQMDIAPNTVTRRLNADEARQIAIEWLHAFGSNCSGIDSDSFLWHVFSANGYPCLSGDAAREAYSKEVSASYVVLSNTRNSALLTTERPTSCSDFDWYVFPPNFAWTMAFTHEEGWLGPYFARHPLYDQLNRENLKALRKAEQAAVARRKGWHN
jgi:hypothetical protein